jgi:hypothetical protein
MFLFFGKIHNNHYLILFSLFVKKQSTTVLFVWFDYLFGCLWYLVSYIYINIDYIWNIR